MKLAQSSVKPPASRSQPAESTPDYVVTLQTKTKMDITTLTSLERPHRVPGSAQKIPPNIMSRMAFKEITPTTVVTKNEVAATALLGVNNNQIQELAGTSIPDNWKQLDPPSNLRHQLENAIVVIIVINVGSAWCLQ